MKRLILTGTPGCGKTSLIQRLEASGFEVIHEATTDLIAKEQSLGNREPWKQVDFIDKIVEIQNKRQIKVQNSASNLQFYDRSPICTYALAIYLKFEPSKKLLDEIKRIQEEKIYHSQVLFLENLGFMTPTDARKISYQESLEFEKIHEEAYSKFGYTCVKIPPVSQEERLERIITFAKQER